MRQDMKTVLTERPRYGHDSKFREVRARSNRGDYDDLPSYEGMRRPYAEGYNNKEFSDHIKPLIRFLWSSVGRRWDDVWSEIAAQVPAGSTVNDHLRGHVFSEIDLHCDVDEDGNVFVKPHVFRWRKPPAPTGLYVDPRDGIIKAGATDWHNSRTRSYKGREPEPPTAYSVPGGELSQIDGIWYSFDHVPCPLPTVVTYVEEGVTKIKLSPVSCYDEYYGTTTIIGVKPKWVFVRDANQWVSRGYYHAKKRQLSSRDLRRYGLSNTR